MLQSIRDNSQGIIAKIIVGLIAVTFALFGVESLVSLTAGSNAPATVNGEEISQQDLYQGVQLQRRQMLAQMGEDADPTLLDENLISNMVLEGLIDQSILVQSAQNQGLTFSDTMIDQLILTTKEFQLDGKFDRTQFEMTLRNAGLTPLMYRSIVRKEKVTEQERIAFMLSAFTLDDELKAINVLQNQTRDLRYFTLPADEVRAEVVVTDEAIAEYYTEHSTQFMSEEQVAIEYLLLERTKLEQAITVTDEELQSAYQQLVDGFQAQEKRHAAHIFIEISDQQDDTAAKAKIDAIAGRLNGGEQFEELAKAESQDPASAEVGGDLGVNEKGVYSTEFEDVLYSLEKGAVSQPVRTEFGYHIIKLIDTVASSVPSFNESQQGLRADLIKQKSEEEYVTQLEQLADISFSSGDLVEPSEELSLEIQKSELFSRSGNEDPITSNNKILAVAFDQELISEGLNSTPVELDSGRAVVLRIVEHQLPREKAQDEVADQIRALLVEQQVATALNDKSTAILAKLEAGEALDSVAVGKEVMTLAAVNRSQRDLPQELLNAAFKLAKPTTGATFGEVDLIDGSKAIIAVEGVGQQDIELQAEELRFMGMMLNTRQGQQDYQDHLNQLKDKAEIEKL